jgi:hypothetical protein
MDGEIRDSSGIVYPEPSHKGIGLRHVDGEGWEQITCNLQGYGKRRVTGEEADGKSEQERKGDRRGSVTGEQV